MKQFAIAIVMAAGCLGCGAELTGPSRAGTGPASALVRNYLTELIGLMRAHSVNRNRIDWEDFTARVMQKAQDDGAQTVPDAYPAIALALALLDDHHSFYTGANGRSVSSPPLPKACRVFNISKPALPDDIGYVQVLAFYGTPAAAVQYADYLHQQMRDADRPDLAEWIVDLRGNYGGNMYPMLAGIGPILGKGSPATLLSQMELGSVLAMRIGSGSTTARPNAAPHPVRTSSFANLTRWR